MTSPQPEQPHLDASEWSRLIERIDPSVILVVIRSWMGRRLLTDCSAEDIWQDALAMAWRDRRAHDWRGLRAFRAWLLGIVRNRIRDRVDHVGAQKRGSGDRGRSLAAMATDVDGRPGAPGSVSDLLPPRTTTPSRVASASEQAAILQQALAAVPEDCRDVVRLRLFEELSINDVATQLGIARATAYDRLLRGAQRYQQELERRLGMSAGES
ncbi:MAG: sigma-70 family RNA polymerase sigma factor [Planctomycetes bacterium]|nr:sigma-70 family RNA polymerase sigma factor [Planctomycetota bacterium]